MKQFTFSEVNRQSGEILDTALIEPVALTKHGKEKLIIITAEKYHHLMGQSSAVAYTLEDAPDDIHTSLLEGLDTILTGENDA